MKKITYPYVQGPRAIRVEGGDIFRARIELALRLARTTDEVTVKNK